ncbi:MAG TPA: nucleoside-diphosphate kinase [Opitutaceae bacterium]|nr:nucleoside-diphosphate kinase [Opitutaceae bacterium]
MQKTLIILKPDCMTQKHVGAVIGRFEAAGFSLVGCKLMQLTPELLREHYAHVIDQPFFPRLEAFMRSAPVLVFVLAGEEVITKVRELLGPTDARKAPKGTIRGDFGTDNTINIAHASDSEASAQAEIARFFRPGELCG